MKIIDAGAASQRYALRFTAGWISAGLLLVALIIYLSLAPGGPPMPVRNIDKLMHLSAYTVLMVWFGGIFKRRAQWFIVFALFGLGVALEYAQGMGGQRVFDPADMAMNGVGVLLGKKLCRFGLEGWCLRVEALVFKIFR